MNIAAFLFFFYSFLPLLSYLLISIYLSSVPHISSLSLFQLFSLYIDVLFSFCLFWYVVCVSLFQASFYLISLKIFYLYLSNSFHSHFLFSYNKVCRKSFVRKHLPLMNHEEFFCHMLSESNSILMLTSTSNVDVTKGIPHIQCLFCYFQEYTCLSNKIDLSKSYTNW